MNKNLQAAFVFYGTPPTGDTLREIRCPVYGFYGGNDNRVTSTIPGASDEMKRAGKAYLPVTYPDAGHGFMRGGEAPDARPADSTAREQAWKRWKELLAKL